MLRESKDDKVKEANVDVRTGRKWVAKSAVEDAESLLRHRDIVGVVTSGRLGFGNIHQPLWQSADTRHTRELVQQEVRRGKEDLQEKKKAVSTKQWKVSKSVLNLVVYAKKQNDADSALRSLEESLIDDYKEKVIDDPVIKDLSKDQEAKIMKLEETCEVEIDINKRIGLIKVRGLIENLSEAMDEVHKILRDIERQKQKQQHAKLVKDMVQWYFISVEDTGQKLEEYPPEVNLLLEQALKNNEPQAFFLDNSGNKYIVDFTNYEEYLEDDPSDTVAVLRKSKMTGSGFDMPSNWAAMDQNENIKIVTLQPADKEYQDVVKDFQTNMAGNYNSIVKLLLCQG
ncbi:protein mono-ADP-ribosyltransferase PARP14-like [Mytilus galloprovincialis]|uniref:protein mono-ADP-ribosyltransferase PARP14-like n=1 Tax=Mytilus galloprovincialis TaxID=29158 RepID=UPI003F7BC1A1